jgi:uridine kinase
MQNSVSREDLIYEIAEVINQIDLPHPVRVAIDGGGAAGKTTFANELIEPLEKLGRNVIRSTIDGFHNPPEKRRKQGKLSPKGYFEDSYDYPQLKKYLLEPLGPTGDLNYKESVYNFRINQPTTVETKKASKNSILIFEGIFLFNEYLFPYWDYKLFIDASFKNTMQRAIVRDNELFGGTDNVIKLYKKRYIPGQKMYLSKHNPIGVSDIVLNNNDYHKPVITKISNNRLHNNLFHIRNSLTNSH